MKFITITPNPALDWTLFLPSLLLRGMVKISREHLACGGKGINVSRVLHRLGESTYAIFPCGGHSGEEFIQTAEQEAFPFSPVPVAGGLRRNVVFVDEKSGEALKINTPGPTLEENEWQRLLQHAVDSGDEGDWAVAAGSLPPGVPDDFYRWLTARLADRGVSAVLDTSGSPLERSLNLQGIIRPRIVKMNLQELSGLWNCPLASLRKVFSQGYRFAEGPEYLISHGAQGALVLSRRGCWIGKSHRTAEHYVVGGGDSLLAGYVRMRQKSSPEEEALAFALACATATALAPLHHLADPDDVRNCLCHIEVRPIDQPF